MLPAAATVNATPVDCSNMNLQTIIRNMATIPLALWFWSHGVATCAGLAWRRGSLQCCSQAQNAPSAAIMLNDGCWAQGQLSRRAVSQILQMPCSNLLVTGQRYLWREATLWLQHSVRKQQTAINQPLKQLSAQRWTGCFKPWSIQQTPMFCRFHIAWYKNAV